MKHKIGDKLKVKTSLNVNSCYYMEDGSRSNTVHEFMVKLSGKIVTIENYMSGQYIIKEDGGAFFWTDEMFEDKKCKGDNNMTIKSKIKFDKAMFNFNNGVYTSIIFKDGTKFVAKDSDPKIAFAKAYLYIELVEKNIQDLVDGDMRVIRDLHGVEFASLVDNTLTLYYNDGTTSQSTRSIEDKFDIHVGLAVAYMNKFFTKAEYDKFIKRLVEKTPN